jgi:hypothetical protein
MTPVQSYVALVRYHLHRPVQIWFLLILMGGQAVFMNYLFTIVLRNQETEIGSDAFGTGYLSLFFSVLMMTAFVGSMVRHASWTWILSNGEFLLSRPILRFRIYLTLWMLAFGVLMICPAINLVFTAFHPDLLLSLAHITPASETVDRLALYQHTFPASSILHLPHRDHATLLVPKGAMMTEWWFFWQVIVASMLLQALSLIQLPENAQRRFMVTVCCAPAAIVLLWKWIGPWMSWDSYFFFFVRHLCGLTLLTLAVFAVLQAVTWRRVQQIEVS